MTELTTTLSARPFRRADRIANIEVSEIVQISESAAAMAAAGQDIISLGTGEPDFPTPDHVCAAATAAMKAGQTRYTPTVGTADLRLAIAAKAGVKPQNVIVSTGAKQVLSNLFLASLNPGDEVISPAPFWTSYRDIVKFSGGRLVEVPCPSEQGFKITPQQLEAAITPATRWLLLNTPSNPSGALYSHGELKALAEVLRAHPNVWIASDEIYEHISYAPFTSVRAVMPDLVDRIVIINGVSKAYSMTGWRIGWAIGPESVIKAMSAVQGQSTSGACSISQAAAVAALTGDQALITSRRAAFEARRDYVVQSINDNPLLDCILPEGAFYLFISCEKTLGKMTPDGTRITDDMAFCAYVLKSAGLALIPGRAFSMPDYFRLSYAYSDAELSNGLSRLRSATDALYGPNGN
ncbi:pyridoxal phosphate-dependent aminotransferase [uncultured Sneathiella sp.]|uniref:pyridoxal phosphate-dependent aminotransferase n=1 Tax=uncultured Sneathiella sp. TaxID=879315 RepID=UPI0030EF1747|tara:strand:- start:110691 stop:111917 length:1227 start_codon:yes stop_codon:yes gene_type:complete